MRVSNVHHQTLYVESGTIEIIQNYSQDSIEIEKTDNMEFLTEYSCKENKIVLKPLETICFLLKKRGA